MPTLAEAQTAVANTTFNVAWFGPNMNHVFGGHLWGSPLFGGHSYFTGVGGAPVAANGAGYVQVANRIIDTLNRYKNLPPASRVADGFRFRVAGGPATRFILARHIAAQIGVDIVGAAPAALAPGAIGPLLPGAAVGVGAAPAGIICDWLFIVLQRQMVAGNWQVIPITAYPVTNMAINLTQPL